MKKQYPEIEHQFDVWHLANSVRKKLLAKSKLRGAEDLGPFETLYLKDIPYTYENPQPPFCKNCPFQ
jgi:hypothetical protein